MNLKLIDLIASTIIYFPFFAIAKNIFKLDMNAFFWGGLSYCIYYIIFEHYMKSDLRKNLTKKNKP